ncbi:LacI family transcriptional regulator [Cnuibacter physcomitrellae]|uniref:LacI family transcriptional regulator n=1 Tax=Cnuibacter physcomitrellae TaxID=1619308 RepID=A0A1X9LS73_9MICO|nr:LacI family DNA-binding transcriptional regulator [Cnuibacter physcomitrellae]ARJ06781.1 LacI family transcriptional regulator [Cnuibacter physcomitrellae]MCS5497866.1 LacI family transcriptional regulator [Cnuibacter physcomitrellae]GGI38812.1 LacI family transcriptional regulator [Cnuibacter physcomitrellae]
MAAANVRDVAALAGVSVGTVSNVLNASKPVAPATAARVQAAIDKLGFVRNESARQLRVGHSRTVGFTLLDISNPFFTDIASAAEETLGRQGRSLVVGNSGDSIDRERTHLDLFEEQRVAGLLITPVGRVYPRLERLRDRGSPVVLVDRHDPDRAFSSVSVDDRHGGFLAAAHLLDQGRRSLAFIGGPSELFQVSQRSAGAHDAVDGRAGAGIRTIETEAMTAEEGRLAAERLLARPPRARPDAIFAANDLIALGVLQALIRAGVRVPDDIALIGYDDIYFASAAAIPLSSIRQPAADIGRTAAEVLLHEIENPDEGDYRHVVFQPELVVRESTA